LELLWLIKSGTYKGASWKIDLSAVVYSIVQIIYSIGYDKNVNEVNVRR
jgi:hypothetical protein